MHSSHRATRALTSSSYGPITGRKLALCGGENGGFFTQKLDGADAMGSALAAEVKSLDFESAKLSSQALPRGVLRLLRQCRKASGGWDLAMTRSPLTVWSTAVPGCPPGTGP